MYKRSKHPEKIYTIPINEAFGHPDGCPLCVLRGKLETDSLTYILGAAMMEPDVRIDVNRQGFCARHLNALIQQSNRLSLALMMESILGRIREKGAAGIQKLHGHCFVCSRVDGFMIHFLENIVYMWRTEHDFKDKLAARRLCLPHTAALLPMAARLLGRGDCESFSRAVVGRALDRAQALQHDISAFCKSFDHRMAKQPLREEVKSAVERTAAFLGGDMN